MPEVTDRTETGINEMNLDQLVEYISDAVVDEIKGGPGSGNWEGSENPRFAQEVNIDTDRKCMGV